MRALKKRAFNFFLSLWVSGYFLIPFFIDRVTKYWVVTYLALPYHLNRYVSLELVINRGISWGVFHSESPFLFFALSTIILALIVLLTYVLIRQAMQGAYLAGYLLVLAGAVSNMVDRFFYQGVIDFVVLQVNGWSWPVFNCADVFIVIGIILIYFDAGKNI